MSERDIHVIPNGGHDWFVKEEGGRELGHYPTLGAAEAVSTARARKRKSELVIHGEQLGQFSGAGRGVVCGSASSETEVRYGAASSSALRARVRERSSKRTTALWPSYR